MWKNDFDKEFYDSNLGCVSLHDTSPDSVTEFIETLLGRVIDDMEQIVNYQTFRSDYKADQVSIAVLQGELENLKTKYLPPTGR